MFSSIPIRPAFAPPPPGFCGKFGLPDGPRSKLVKTPYFGSFMKNRQQNMKDGRLTRPARRQTGYVKRISESVGRGIAVGVTREGSCQLQGVNCSRGIATR
jgi:hypothetical protein